MRKARIKLLVAWALALVYAAAGVSLVVVHTLVRLAAGGGNMLGAAVVMVEMVFFALLPLVFAHADAARLRRLERPPGGVDGFFIFALLPVVWVCLVLTLFVEPPDPRWPPALAVIGYGMLAVVFTLLLLPVYVLSFDYYKMK